MKSFYDIIKRPLITEKAVMAKEMMGRYSFEVALAASKPVVRKAVEDFFKVKVQEIKTMIIHGKKRRIGRYTGKRPNWKKAIVTLEKGQKIELFETK